jgi:hypothetical protein
MYFVENDISESLAGGTKFAVDDLKVRNAGVMVPDTEEEPRSSGTEPLRTSIPHRPKFWYNSPSLNSDEVCLAHRPLIGIDQTVAVYSIGDHNKIPRIRIPNPDHIARRPTGRA